MENERPCSLENSLGMAGTDSTQWPRGRYGCGFASEMKGGLDTKVRDAPNSAENVVFMFEVLSV